MRLLCWTGTSLQTQQFFTGRVTSTGAGSDLPLGWSVATPSTGVYVITHNLALVDPLALRLIASPLNPSTIGAGVQITAETANTITVTTTNGKPAAMAFYFFAALR